MGETWVNSEHRTFSKSSEGPRISRRRVLAPTGTHRTELEGRSCTLYAHAFFIIKIFPPELGPEAADACGKYRASRANRANRPIRTTFLHAAPAWRSDDWSLLHHPVVNLEASWANRKACDPPVTRRQNGKCIKVSVQG